MKQILLVLVICAITLSTYANLDTFCESKKGDTGHYKNGDNYYIYKGPFLYKFEDDQIRLIFSKYEIRSVREYGKKLYILTPDYIFVHGLGDYEFITSFPSTNQTISKKHETAQDMAILNNKLYIAHGSLGIIKIDLQSNSIESTHFFDLPHETGQLSTATGIDTDSRRIYVMLDNVTYNFSTKKRAYEGLVILDENLNQERVVPIRQNREALHMPKAIISGEYLVSRNLQNLYFYKLGNIDRVKTLWPKRRLYDFAGVDLKSNPWITNNKVYGCFNLYNGKDTKYMHRQFQL